MNIITITPPNNNSPTKFIPNVPSIFSKTKSAIHSPSQGSPFSHHKITRQISEQCYIDDKENVLAPVQYARRTSQNVSANLYRSSLQSPKESTRFENLHDLIASGALNSEILVRTYFHQIIEAVEDLHKKEIAHLDLKLEKFVLNSNFYVRLLGSDCSQAISDTSVFTEGTKIYRAPEVKTGTCNNLAAADIYSLGIMLYALKTNEFPYGEKEDEDSKRLRYYSTFRENNKLYWEAKAKLRGGNEVFSQDFIELVNSMLENDSNKRITMEEIKQSKFYQGDIVGSDQLNMDIKKKYRVLNEANSNSLRQHDRYYTPKRY
jgi:serine/threonine protein kinase